MGDEDAAVADLTNQGAEGLLVALLAWSTIDRSTRCLLVFDAGLAPSPSMSVGVAGIVRYRRPEQRATEWPGVGDLAAFGRRITTR